MALAQHSGKFECGEMLLAFSVTTNTIFHVTHLSLETWFLAVNLIAQSKKGTSSCQILRTSVSARTNSVVFDQSYPPGDGRSNSHLR
jgi:hypothetical protein